MPTLGRQRQVELYEFEASLWDPVLAYTYSLKWKLTETHAQKDDSCLKPRQSLGNRVSEAPQLLWGLKEKVEGAPLGPQEVVWWVSCLGNQKVWLLRLTATTNPGQDIYTDEQAELWSPKSSYIDVLALTNSEHSCIWRQNLYRSKWGPVSMYSQTPITDELLPQENDFGRSWRMCFFAVLGSKSRATWMLGMYHMTTALPVPHVCSWADKDTDRHRETAACSREAWAETNQSCQHL